MINILEVCNESGILSVVYFVKVMLDLVFIILPIILIVMILVDFTKNVLAKGDDDIKRNNKIVIKRIVYCIIAFFVPTIVNVVINAVYNLTSDGGNNENALVCWEKATIDNIEDLREKEEEERKAEEEKNKQQNQDKYNQDQQEIASNKGNGGLSGKDPEEGNTGTTGNGGTTTNPGTTTVNNYTLYVGDSRTVGMCDVATLSSNEECHAKESIGFAWLENLADVVIDEKLKSNPTANLVINLGINDFRVNDYITKYKEFETKYPNAKIIVVSLTPVEDYPTITNSKVDDFNTKLKNGLSSTNIKFCDINDKITGTGITTDGVHHTNEVYKQIHELIKQCL